jgi:peroxiredoxin
MRCTALTPALAIALSFVFRVATAAPEGEPTLAEGAAAPHFSLKPLNPALARRESFSLRDSIGPERGAARALILSFSASYCAPCKKELALLAREAEALAKAGIAVATVSIDAEPSGIEAMRALAVDELKLPFPVLSDRLGIVGRRYGVSVLPTTFLIGPDGRVRRISRGFGDEELAAFLAAARAG